MTQKPGISREVHYVLANGEHRTAKVVNAWGDTTVNLVVELDPANDFDWQTGGVKVEKLRTTTVTVGARMEHGRLTATSVQPDEDTKRPGTWHYPERAE